MVMEVEKNELSQRGILNGELKVKSTQQPFLV